MSGIGLGLRIGLWLGSGLGVWSGLIFRFISQTAYLIYRHLVNVDEYKSHLGKNLQSLHLMVIWTCGTSQRYLMVKVKVLLNVLKTGHVQYALNSHYCVLRPTQPPTLHPQLDGK